MTTTTHPSAVERLAAALFQAPDICPGDCENGEHRAADAAAILAADPTLASDIEDGTELRLLRAALDDGEGTEVELSEDPSDDSSVRWMVRFLDAGQYGMGPTLAAAAKACREALEATR